MANWIKEAISEEQRDEAQKQIRDTVEKLLEDIKKLISNWHRSGTWKVKM